MNKQQFLAELRKHLFGLPQDDIKQPLDYYAEIIDDRIEDGISEEDAVSDIGDPKEIAKQILIDIPLPKLIKQKIKPKRRLKVWEIVLLALGAPVWLPIIIAVVAIILSVYVVFWSVVASLYAVNLSVAFCGVAGVVGAIYGQNGRGYVCFGCGDFVHRSCSAYVFWF